MIITLIAEARSGSTNLAKWLQKSLPNFTLLNEPFNYRSSDYVGENGKINYDRNLIISKKYFFNEPLIVDVINNSDKVFCLQREDLISQMESYIMAHKTNNWYDEYSPNGVYDNINENMILELKRFEKSKLDFKEFIKINNLKTFTYEDLYYNGGIDGLKSYLNIESDVDFPYGKKYRKDIDKRTMI